MYCFFIPFFFFHYIHTEIFVLNFCSRQILFRFSCCLENLSLPTKQEVRFCNIRLCAPPRFIKLLILDRILCIVYVCTTSITSIHVSIIFHGKVFLRYFFYCRRQRVHSLDNFRAYKDTWTCSNIKRRTFWNCVSSLAIIVFRFVLL